MTVDELPPPAPAQPALDEYHKSLLWRRRIYAGAVVALLIAVAIAVKVAYSHGEISHATLHTVPNQLPSPIPQPLSPAPKQAWRSTDHTAIGTPISGGTVVTYGSNVVRGRDALTGKITWSYTRTDRTVCSAIQVQGVTIAVFRLRGNCDQLTALDAQTGTRKWERTLDKDGQPVNGTPTYSVGDFTLLITTPDVIYAIDPNGGLDRWTFAERGCTIHGAVLGVSGALISQTCDKPDCTGLKFCKTGDQLLLRDATAGRSDEDKDKSNPDRIKWNVVGPRVFVPVSADKLTSAADPGDNSLRVLDVAKGSLLAELPLSGNAPDAGAVAQQVTAQAELIWVGGVTYSVQPTGAAFAWSVPTAGPPVAVPAPGAADVPVDLNAATVLVPTETGVDSLVPRTGTRARHFAVEAPPQGSRAYPVSSGFLVAGESTSAYR